MLAIMDEYPDPTIYQHNTELALRLYNPLFRLDSSGDVRVGDFGLAEDVYSTGYFRQNKRADIKLPYKWMALESLNDAKFTEKTDVVRFNYSSPKLQYFNPPAVVVWSDYVGGIQWWSDSISWSRRHDSCQVPTERKPIGRSR